MRLTLTSIRPGGTHAGEWDRSVEEYLKRCGRVMEAEGRVFRTEAALLEGAAARRREGALALWLADAGGSSLSSEAFAAKIGSLRASGVRQLWIAVGPANGWSDGARKLAELRVSLGPMTLPHELARLVLAEQVYRATAILSGHPYHAGH